MYFCICIYIYIYMHLQIHSNSTYCVTDSYCSRGWFLPELRIGTLYHTISCLMYSSLLYSKPEWCWAGDSLTLVHPSFFQLIKGNHKCSNDLFLRGHWVPVPEWWLTELSSTVQLWETLRSIRQLPLQQHVCTLILISVVHNTFIYTSLIRYLITEKCISFTMTTQCNFCLHYNITNYSLRLNPVLTYYLFLNYKTHSNLR